MPLRALYAIVRVNSVDLPLFLPLYFSVKFSLFLVASETSVSREELQISHIARKRCGALGVASTIPIPYVSNTVHSHNSWNVGGITNLKLQYQYYRRITITMATSTYVHIELYVHTYTNMYIGTCGYIYKNGYVRRCTRFTLNNHLIKWPHFGCD